MHFQDLSTYHYDAYYGIGNLIFLSQVLNVGWLESGFEYSHGTVDSVTIEKLAQIITVAENALLAYKGYHLCDFCGTTHQDGYPKVSYGDITRKLGSKVIWLPVSNASEVFFAAPDLVYHYIAAHQYRPPDPFLEAVNQFDVGSTWNALKEFRKQVEDERAKIDIARKNDNAG
jgi:hypothetical protein